MAQFYEKRAIMLNDLSKKDIYQCTDSGLILNYNLKLVIDAVNNLFNQDSDSDNQFKLIKDESGKSYRVKFVKIIESAGNSIFPPTEIKEIDTISFKFYQILEMNDKLDIIEKKSYKLIYTPRNFQYINSKIIYTEDIKNFENFLADDLFAIVKMEINQFNKN